ncbi:MAG: FMN-binding protein [Pseudomonadales bacterium]|nr:FMN-binding protein [Pseudomonadales bacterium]
MKVLLLTLLLSFSVVPKAAAEQYMTQEAFLTAAFSGEAYKKQKLWLNKKMKQVAKQILKHDYNALRVRYWGAGHKTAWILEEIGKERPITIGVAVSNGQIDRVNILEFRESRGWEVRYPFFTEQFDAVGVDDEYTLTKNIDGISGATLSVRAVKKVAALALYLHTQTDFANSAQ